MDFCKRYETVQVTAEDAVFYLLKRSLADMPRGVHLGRPTPPGQPGAATFVASGTRWAIPMSEAVRIICGAHTSGIQVLQELAAVSGKRVANLDAEYRTTLKLVDDEMDRKPENIELVRGLSVLRGAIATCLTVSSLCLAA